MQFHRCYRRRFYPAEQKLLEVSLFYIPYPSIACLPRITLPASEMICKCVYGAHKRNRTFGLFLTKELLFRLSYAGDWLGEAGLITYYGTTILRRGVGPAHLLVAQGRFELPAIDYEPIMLPVDTTARL